MESIIQNSINLIQTPEKLLKYLMLLESTAQILNLDIVSIIKAKFTIFGIDSDKFNYTLWKKLNSCISEFNYLKLARSEKKKQKWILEILQKIPKIELLSIFHDECALFKRFKDVLSDPFVLYFLNNLDCCIF